MSAPRISALIAGNSLRASTAALTKKDMKPSLTPCFSWNRSRCWFRRRMTTDISISLNVVSRAAVVLGVNQPLSDSPPDQAHGDDLFWRSSIAAG